MYRASIQNRFFKITLGMILVFFMPQSNTASAAGKTIGTLKIGVILPLSGKMEIFGKELKDGFEIGIARAQRSKKINSGNIQVFYRDSQGSAKEAEDQAEKLLKKERVSIIVGGFSTPESNALAQISQKNNRLYISLLSKEIEDLSKMSNTFMLSSTYRWQSEVAAEYVAKYAKSPITAVITPDETSPKTNLIITTFTKALLKKSTTRILQFRLDKENTVEEESTESPEENSPETKSIAVVQEESEPQGSETVEKDPVDPLARYKKIALEIKNSRADIVFFPLNWGVSEPIITELENIDYKGKILGLEYWESKIAYKKLYNLDDMVAYHVTHYRPDFLPSDFVSEFKNTFYRVPSSLAALGFDAASTVTYTYSEANSIRTPPLLEKLKKAKEIPGIISNLRMGWDKSFERAMAISSLRSGGNNAGIIVRPNNL